MNVLLDDIATAGHDWDLAIFQTGEEPRAIHRARVRGEGDQMLAFTGGRRLSLIGYVTACHPNNPIDGAFEVEGLPAEERGGPGHAEQVVHAYPAGSTLCPICRGGSWFDPTRISGATDFEGSSGAESQRLLDPADCPALPSHRDPD